MPEHLETMDKINIRKTWILPQQQKKSNKIEYEFE